MIGVYWSIGLIIFVVVVMIFYDMWNGLGW